MLDFVENTLKKLSVKELETIIAKAVSDAVGDKFESSITSIDYGKDTDETTIILRLGHPSTWDKPKNA